MLGLSFSTPSECDKLASKCDEQLNSFPILFLHGFYFWRVLLGGLGHLNPTVVAVQRPAKKGYCEKRRMLSLFEIHKKPCFEGCTREAWPDEATEKNDDSVCYCMISSDWFSQNQTLFTWSDDPVVTPEWE